MQDKKDLTPSPEDTLVNEAWAQMAQLLDEQMPVAALPWWRQRRYYLLLLLLMLFLTSAAGLWWNQQTPTPSVPTKPEVPESIAQQGSEKASQTTTSELPAALSTPRPEAESISASMLPPPQSHSVYSPQIAEISTNPVESFTGANISEVLDKESVISPKLLSELENLPTLEPLLFPRAIPAPALTAEEAPAQPSPWSLSTTAGLGMRTPNRIGLGWVDMRVQRTLGKSEKWRLGAGLGVLRAEFPDQSLDGIDFLAAINSMEDMTGVAGESFSSTDERAALEASLAMRYTFLRMPLELSRRLTTRLHLRFGAEAGFLLKTNSVEVQRDAHVSNTPTYRVEELFRTQRFDIRPTLGLGYRISPSLEADLRYQFGLVKLHPQYPTPTYNRFLELGLRWNW